MGWDPGPSSSCASLGLGPLPPCRVGAQPSPSPALRVGGHFSRHVLSPPLTAETDLGGRQHPGGEFRALAVTGAGPTSPRGELSTLRPTVGSTRCPKECHDAHWGHPGALESAQCLEAGPAAVPPTGR